MTNPTEQDRVKAERAADTYFARPVNAHARDTFVEHIALALAQERRKTAEEIAVIVDEAKHNIAPYDPYRLKEPYHCALLDRADCELDELLEAIRSRYLGDGE